MALFFNAGFDLSKLGTTFSMKFTRATETTAFVTAGLFLTTTNVSSYKVIHGVGDWLDEAELPDGTTPLSGWAVGSFADNLQACIIKACAAWDDKDFVVTRNATTGKYTITEDEVFAVTFTNALSRQILGVTGGYSWSGTSTYTGTAMPYYSIKASLDELSQVSDEYEPSGGSALSVSDGYTVDGIARTVAPIYFDFTQMYEPLATVFERGASTTAPWTWWHLFDHCRTVWPILVVGAHWGDDPVIMLREEGAHFDPEPWYPDDHTKWNIPFRGLLLGYL